MIFGSLFTSEHRKRLFLFKVVNIKASEERQRMQSFPYFKY